MSTARLLLALVVCGVAWRVAQEEATYCVGTSHAECSDFYFSQTYWEARGRFRLAARAAGATELLQLLVHEDPVSGRRYTQDVAIFPGDDPSRLLIHMSGTHGPEGYAGSAIQLALLDSWKESIAATQGNTKTPTVVLVHAVNPFGFAENRRWNEHGVDLNRNVLLTEGEWQRVRTRDENHSGYSDWSAVINMPHFPSLFDHLAFYPRIAFFVLKHGFSSIMRALVSGTYHTPTGIFYGGDTLQTSHKNLLNMFKERFANTTKSVVLIDVHTGLGPAGQDTFMCDDAHCADKGRILFPQHAEGGWVGDESTGDESGASAGAYNLATGFTDAYVKVFPHIGDRYFAAAEEFGTMRGVFVAKALIMENAFYNHARGTAGHRAAGHAVRDAFYTQALSWKRDVIANGLLAVRSALHNMDKAFFSHQK